MEVLDTIMTFIERAQADHRVGPIHMSLYLGLLRLWADQGFPVSIEVRARVLMPVAKIAGSGPYHRTIRQLDAWGYIRYEPSCDPAVGSRVYLG